MTPAVCGALALAALERAAEEAGIEPFAVYTEAELLKLLEKDYGPEAGRFPKFLTKALMFRTSFVRSKKLWKRGQN